MVYRFLILSDEEDDFAREININPEASFYDFHEAILASVGYRNDQMTSFFLCSDNWEKEQEITLMEMDSGSEYDSLVMTDTVLQDYVEDEGQKLLYVFDYLSERAFFIELQEIVLSQQIVDAKCTFSKGKAPSQQLSEEEMMGNVTANAAFLSDDSFLDDDGFDIDELDEDGFSGLDGAADIAIEDANF
ncbi:MAG: hypothetical protein LBR75_01135 [Prevotellaceae bacterium]|jgi:hypothetical protein|nr:hypothetical protein [Prevotellaceae bacterium]